MKRLVFCLTLVFSILFLSSTAFAKATNSYFYDQLSQDQQEIYNAIDQMKEKGLLQKGDESFVIEKIGFELQVLINKVSIGNSTELLTSFTRAKDAYKYDHPEVFYVDFDQLSIRVTSDQNGLLCELGIGRSNNYYALGFNKQNIDSKIKTFNNKVDEIIKRLPTEKEENDLTLEQTQLRYLHNYLTENMVYKYNYELSETQKQVNSTRNAYDGLINQAGVCEAYTRAFKVLCDKASIPCISVYGTYKYSKGYGEHIWNYVQIRKDGDNQWYAIDVTQDDPIYYSVSGIRDYINEKLKSGRETTEFFLVGQSKLGISHFEEGILSPTTYIKFEYPTLSYDPPTSDMEVTSDNLTGDLKIKTFTSKSEEVDSMVVRVSFRGSGYQEAKKAGYYILMRTAGGMSVSSTDDGFTDWFYLTPELFSIVEESSSKDPDLGGDYTEFPITNAKMVQIAITTKPSLWDELKDAGEEIKPDQYNDLFFFNGSIIDDFVTVSDTVVTPFDPYLAPPYPTKTTPAMNSALIISESNVPTFNMSATFNQKLIRTEEELKIKVTAYNVLSATWSKEEYLDEYTSLSDVNFDSNTNTVTWKFKPSGQYADSSNNYYFQIEGLVGEISNKKPIELSWGITYSAPCILRCRAAGYDKLFYGNPTLLEEPNFENESEWQARDPNTGNPIDFQEILKDINVRDRLALITTTPTSNEQNNLKNTLIENNPDINTEISEINFYQITLAYCGKTVYKTGEKVKICIGFPQSLTYQNVIDKNIDFKMYHYKSNEKGELTNEVELIPVTITPQGIIIEVDSFSPFALVQTNNVNNQSKSKTIILGNNEGGSISVSESNSNVTFVTNDKGENLTNQIVLEPGQVVSLSIKAKEDFVINSINEYGYDKEVIEKLLPYTTGSTNEEIVIGYDDLIGIGNVTIAPSFIKKSVIDTDILAGRNSNFSSNEPIIPNTLLVKPNSELTIISNLDNVSKNDITNYQWYKLDSNNQSISIANAVADTLTINNSSYNDAGIYYLSITLKNGQVITSNKCKVTVGYVITFDLNNNSNESITRITSPNNTIEDIPNVETIPNYNFVGWFTSPTNGTEITKKTVFNNDTTVYAHWKLNTDNNQNENNQDDTGTNQTSFRITASTNPSNSGTVSGVGRFLKGTVITLKAIANQGYHFVYWTLNGNVVSYNESLAIKVTDNLNYVANFIQDESSEISFNLDKEIVYLSTLEGAINTSSVKVNDLSDELIPQLEWINNTPMLIETSSDGINLTIKGLKEGVGTVKARIGEVTKDIKVIISNNDITVDDILISRNNIDTFTVTAYNIQSNPALNKINEISNVSMFAWSSEDQSDINAKIAQTINDKDWSYTYPINETPINNHFINAKDITIHVYASSDNSNGDFIGSKTYDYTEESKASILATPYSQNLGFITPTIENNNEVIGTVGRALHLEGLRLATSLDGVDLVYSVHMADIGWSKKVSEGSYAGTMNQNRQLEAIKIYLTGPNADKYYIRYQAHVADKGWLDWVSEGQTAGTEGEARRLEAIKIDIISK